MREPAFGVTFVEIDDVVATGRHLDQGIDVIRDHRQFGLGVPHGWHVHDLIADLKSRFARERDKHQRERDAIATLLLERLTGRVRIADNIL